MAKAKLMKVKRGRLRIERISKILFGLSFALYIGANILVGAYNITLAMERDEMLSIQKECEQTVSTMRMEVNQMENSKDVLDFAKKEGIDKKQENIVILPSE